MDMELKDHPTTIAYTAGQAFAKSHHDATLRRAWEEADKYDDPDAFMDGFSDSL